MILRSQPSASISEHCIPVATAPSGELLLPASHRPAEVVRPQTSRRRSDGTPCRDRPWERPRVHPRFPSASRAARAGTVDVAIPKLGCRSCFPEWLLERGRRAERALIHRGRHRIPARRLHATEREAGRVGWARRSTSQVSTMAAVRAHRCPHRWGGGMSRKTGSVNSAPRRTGALGTGRDVHPDNSGVPAAPAR